MWWRSWSTEPTNCVSPTELRSSETTCEDAKTVRWTALELPSLDCHCRTNICAMCQSQSKFGTSPGGCGSCRGPSLMLCCCSVVPGIMVTVYACCLDNKVENLSAGSLQTAHIAHPSRSISATLSRGHLWSWRLRQVWMDEWLVKTRPCNGSLRPEELDAGNKGEQRGTKLSKKTLDRLVWRASGNPCISWVLCILDAFASQQIFLLHRAPREKHKQMPMDFVLILKPPLLVRAGMCLAFCCGRQRAAVGYDWFCRQWESSRI